MGVSSVELGDKTLMDITDSTVTKDNLLKGAIAYGADGEKIVGDLGVATSEKDGLMSSSDKGKLDGIADGANKYESNKDNANALINSLEIASATPSDNDYYVSQYANGGTSNTTYHRRPLSALWKWIQTKVFVKSGSSASAGLVPKPPTTTGTSKFLCEDATWKTPKATVDTLTTMEQVEAATDNSKAVGAGAIKELNSNIGFETKVIDGVPNWRERGADTWNPFSSKFELFGNFNTGTNTLTFPRKPYTIIVLDTQEVGKTCSKIYIDSLSISYGYQIAIAKISETEYRTVHVRPIAVYVQY